MTSRLFQIANPIAFAMLLSFGCRDGDGDNTGDGGDDTADTNRGDGGDGTADADTSNGSDDDTQTLGEDDICYEIDQGIDEITSRVMLLEDKSGSMDDPLAGEGTGGDRKWDIAVDAIASMVTTFEESIAFGLDLFPAQGSRSSCDVGTSVAADVAYNNAGTIIDILPANPDGATPLLLAMENFLDASYAPEFTNGEPGGYLVVISDGMDTCGAEGGYDRNGGADADELADVTARLLDEQGIQTFVIGFGDGVDPDQLNAIAEAGGTQFDTFFDAQNEQKLSDALDSIGRAVVVSCRYQLGTYDSEEVNLDWVNITFDDTAVPRNDGCDNGDAGWMWGNDERTIIEFCPDSCEELESGTVDNLRVVIACSAEGVDVV